MTFDISSIAVSETTDIEINDPRTGEPLLNDQQKPITVTVFGPGSKQYAAAKSAASNKSLKRFRAKGKLDTTPEEDAASTASFLTPCTAAFNGFVYNGMEPGPDMFRACYLDPKMGWFTEQVNKEMGDWSNFTKGSESS